MSTYNGWSNRETWCANLHITNDFSMQKTFECEAENYSSAYDFGKYIKDVVGETIDEVKERLNNEGGFGAMLLIDLLNEGKINWTEIAQQYEEYFETPEEE